MSWERHTIHLFFGAHYNPEPKGVIAATAMARLDIGSSLSLVGGVDHESSAYLRRLATSADKLADAIDARLAESTAGETRDVPTPGAAG